MDHIRRLLVEDVVECVARIPCCHETELTPRKVRPLLATTQRYHFICIQLTAGDTPRASTVSQADEINRLTNLTFDGDLSLMILLGYPFPETAFPPSWTTVGL